MDGHTIKIRDKEFEILITAERIQRRVSELALEIETDYQDKNPVFIGVLNGAVMFATDLVRRFRSECELTFIRVASYHGNTSSSGIISSVIGLKENLANRHVLIVEDIVDSGNTAMHLISEIKKHNPASLKFATALFKPEAMKYDYKPDYIGFETGPDFIIGYGLDYDGLGRNLNDIYVLKS
jgi:hypoxanthine phosphoribosyltransferase